MVAAQGPDQPLVPVTVNLSVDTSVLSLFPTKNYGTSKTLDANRALVNVSQEDLRTVVGANDYIESAKLRFNVVPSLLPRLKRTISAHRVLKPWTEEGATWGCAVDANTTNLKSDCSGATAWNMNSAGDAYDATAEGTAILPTFRSGTIEIDVTDHVRDGIHRPLPGYTAYGWMLKTDIPDLTLLQDLASVESSTPPQLVMVVRHCSSAMCNDGNMCNVDFCNPDNAFCMYISSPPVACDDHNACTIEDKCLSQACSGTPAPAGTECGSGLSCDGAGECVESAN